MKTQYDVLILGGGAAGFFGAIHCAELLPGAKIAILEKSDKVLQKVKVSGGGRCNVTHACFIPKELVQFYPRGRKELLGPFHRFACGDTMDWFESRGVPLKIEDDGRVFPVSDNSQSIIDCLMEQCKKFGIEIHTGQDVVHIQPEENKWQVKTRSHKEVSASQILMATGSNPRIWQLLHAIGLKVIEPVPSLFTFNIKDERISDLPGIAVPQAEVAVIGSKLKTAGPLLITHWGMSGPAILKLSAWGAREFAQTNYHFDVKINWNKHTAEVLDSLKSTKIDHPKKKVAINPMFGMPLRLWQKMTQTAQINPNLNWADLSNKHIEALSKEISEAVFNVSGKSTFKEEFVTAGGLDLTEVDFKTFGSKKFPGLHFAGEILDIDAVTGGFNFQAAWTGGWIAAEGIAQNVNLHSTLQK